jgi:CheY-like chemotaxis protein
MGLGVLVAVSFFVKRRLDLLHSTQAVARRRLEAILAEDKSLVRFFNELRDGLLAPDSGADPLAAQNAAATASDPLEGFLVSAPGRIARLRSLLSDVSRAADDVSRQGHLARSIEQASLLKDGARIPQLRPVWLVGSALEGLLKQLSTNLSEITPSVIGTADGAVDLLETLSVPGLDPDLATEPPVHLLAVDDDPVSRLAVSFALKKAFNPPDLAPDGETALGLIASQTYDVIFLDVDMPGVDGYELCTRIHQNERHRTTPVVFVTRHGDFNSRAKSTQSGGEDLIAKPFLAFEITVKALTLAMRGRLARKAEPQPVQADVPAIAAMASELAVITPIPTAQTLPELNGRKVHSSVPEPGFVSTNGRPTWEIRDNGFQTLFKGSRDEPPDAFLAQAPALLEGLRNQLHAVQRAVAPAELQGFLGQLYVGAHAFNAEAERAELRAMARLSSALEGMLKKLLDRSNLFTPSTVNAASAALDLLEELGSGTSAHPDLTQPPVRILVVDDDPVARRSVSGAVQLAFGRPDDADSGEAALDLANEKTYDLIFLDVLMPGMDGFTACSRIHKSPLNRRTPIIFVTGQDDTEARSKAVAAGGCGFIPKPVLASQIKLTALTFILRARLDRPSASPVCERATALEMA